MKVEKIGAAIVITDSTEYPGQEHDVTSMHARSKVTATHTVITDLANSNLIWSCPNLDFLSDVGSVTDQASIKAYLRPIIGS